jgi:hypothetical protein
MTTADSAASRSPGGWQENFSGDLAGCAPVFAQPAEDLAAGGIGDRAKDVPLLTLYRNRTVSSLALW